jgi:transcriptional regulator with XRE-family HTH domain
MNIGNALKRIRSALAMGQGELSELTGLSISMISAIETGDRTPSEETIENLMTVLSLSREELELICLDDLSKFAARYRKLAGHTQQAILEAIASQYRARKRLGLAMA